MASTSSTTSQPIALPITHRNLGAPGSYVDYQMTDGSYTGSSGPFNPASYTRHFLGSPISWRASSLNAGSFPQRIAEHPCHGSIDTNEIHYGRTCSSSVDNRESILNALNLFDREGELCRNYTCCGLHLNDLHALLEHFESVHIVVVDGNPLNPQMQVPFSPIVHLSPLPQPLETPAAFDPDDMELELDLDNTTAPLALAPPTSHSSPSSSAPSSPDTPILTPAWSSPRDTPAPSVPSSPQRFKTAAPTRTSSPVSSSALRPNLSLNLGSTSVFSRVHAPSPYLLTNPEEAFNSYARFSQDYSSGLPGAQYNAAPADETSMVIAPSQTPLWQNGGQQQSGCVPPALLFSGSTMSALSESQVPSPTSYAHAIAQVHAQQQRALQTSSMPTTPISSTSSSRTAALSRASSSTAASPSLLLSKPFKCPKPNCNKSYKQANGLKYHMTHGSCNFAPPKDLEHVKDLLERKKRERERERERELGLGRAVSTSGFSTPNTSGPATPTTELAAEYGITEMDLREVEREAERRLRPFACGVGDCQRRYKNMNGLRYHYQHSGEHGAQGLALLASGQHECLQGAKRNHHGAHGQQTQPNQTSYATVEDKEGKKRLVIRPNMQQPHPQTQQVQEQRTSVNAGSGASVMVPVAISDQQQHSQIGQGNVNQIRVTPVVVSPQASQQGQGQQHQSHVAVYAGQYPSMHQPQNPYAYACYVSSNTTSNSATPVTTSPPSATSVVNISPNQTPVSAALPISSVAYQQQAGYFGNTASATYLGINLGAGPNHSGTNSVEELQSEVYSQSAPTQLVDFHQQLEERYKGYATQRSPEGLEATNGMTV